MHGCRKKLGLIAVRRRNSVASYADSRDNGASGRTAAIIVQVSDGKPNSERSPAALIGSDPIDEGAASDAAPPRSLPDLRGLKHGVTLTRPPNSMRSK